MNSDTTVSANSDDQKMFDFLTLPIEWKPRTERSVASDNESESPQVDENLIQLPCASASTLKRNTHTCDFDYDLIVNPFMARALEVIEFYVLFDHETGEVEEVTKPFKPEMAHQIFGNDEVIVGYRNLKLNFSILPNSFHTKFDYSHSARRQNPLRGEIPDNIEEKLQEWFPHIIGADEFNRLKETEDLMKVHGEILLTFSLIDINNVPTNIYITKCDQTDAEFLKFHKRFQALIVFFIDAASVIEFMDPNWSYYYVYKDILKDGKVIAKLPVGFCTVYKFVLSKRARISQFFILPNFQQRGLGTRLLGVIYKQLLAQDDVKYITVEYPCEEFSLLRDKLDLHMIIKLAEFARDAIMEGYTPAMGIAAEKFLKLCSEQVKHLVAVLRCYYSKTDNNEYNTFIRDLKLNFHYKYKGKLMRLVCKAGNEERIAILKRIVHDDYLVNSTIHREVMSYVKRMSPHMNIIETLLSRT